MISDASEQAKAMPAMLYLYVPNVDAAYQLAIKAGATSVMEPADQFYGDRGGKFEDPFGHRWWIATRKEDVPPDELRRRAVALFGTCPD